ncbi:MAG: TlpA family protein disulfide reductase [Candidatus Methylomirabilia bacterium]
MKKLPVVVALAGMLITAFTAPAHAEKARKLGEGDGVFRPVALAALPDVRLRDTLTPGQRTYLGLGASGPFTIGAVRGDLVFVEFFNSSCYACALMAPVMDQTWRTVDARTDLKDRVRFVGIGVGNTLDQVREFHDRYDTPFPMLADPEFAAFDALGTLEGTPYLLLLRRGADGTVTGRAQVGYMPQADVLVAALEAALADVAPAEATPRELAGSGWRTLKPPLTEAELDARLIAAAAEAGLAGAVVAPVKVSADETFYRLTAAGKSLWAMVAGRAKVCNVCHDIFFIVVFDDAGLVVDLAPIVITKYKNVEFDADDVAFLKARVVGRLLSREIVFDPTVDAVSMATMSSALVFDTLRRLRETWAGMVKSGLSKDATAKP